MKTLLAILAVIVSALNLLGEGFNIYEKFGLPTDGKLNGQKSGWRLQSPRFGMNHIFVSTNGSDGVIYRFEMVHTYGPFTNDLEELEIAALNVRNQVCEEFRCEAISSTPEDTKFYCFSHHLRLLDYEGWTVKVTVSCQGKFVDGEKSYPSYGLRCSFDNRWKDARHNIAKAIAMSKEDDIHWDPVMKNYYFYVRDKESNKLKRVYPNPCGVQGGFKGPGGGARVME